MGVVAYTFISSTLEAEQEDLCGFEMSPVYKVSVETARTT